MMISKENIARVAERFLEKRDQFLVKINVGTDNNISIFIDGIHGVTIDDCVSLSRHIEASFDREEEDYELSVSSTGIDHPFEHLSQYTKNIGRAVELTLTDGSVKKGILEAANAEQIELAEEVIKKNRKSKKMIVGDVVTIEMANIERAKAIILF